MAKTALELSALLSQMENLLQAGFEEEVNEDFEDQGETHVELEENDIVSYSPTEAPFCHICRYQTLTSRHLLTTSIKKNKKKSILIIEH